MNSFLRALKQSPGARSNAIFAIGGVGLSAMDKSLSPEERRKEVGRSVVDGLAQMAAGNSFGLGLAYSLAISAAFAAPQMGKAYVELSRLGIQEKSMLAQPFSHSGIGPRVSYAQIQHAKGLMEDAYGFYDGNPARNFAAMHSR